MPQRISALRNIKREILGIPPKKRNRQDKTDLANINKFLNKKKRKSNAKKRQSTPFGDFGF